MKSLRTRLLVGMIGSFALLLVAFGLVIDALIEYTLVREFHFYLETVARTLAAAAQVGGDRVEVKLVPEPIPDIQQVEGELFSQYWKDDGTVLAKSRNLADHSLPRNDFNSTAADAAGGTVCFTSRSLCSPTVDADRTGPSRSP